MILTLPTPDSPAPEGFAHFVSVKFRGIWIVRRIHLGLAAALGGIDIGDWAEGFSSDQIELDLELLPHRPLADEY